MRQAKHLNFELRLEKAGKGYRVLLIDSGGVGEVRSKGISRFLEQVEIDKFFTELQNYYYATRLQKVQGKPDPQLDFATKRGKELATELFRLPYQYKFIEAHQKAIQEQRPVRIRLRLDGEDSELQNQPWEYLYLADRFNKFLLLDPQVTLVRYLEQTQPLATLLPHTDTPLSVLVLVGAETPQRMKKWQDEISELDRIFQANHKQVNLVTPRLEDYADLRGWIRESAKTYSFRAMHYIGHGSFEAENGYGTLQLPDGKGGIEHYTGQKLKELIKPLPNLQLITLLGCESGKASPTIPHSSVVAGLSLSGVPAVVAMQFVILDETSFHFSCDLYHALALGQSLDDALAYSRQCIYLQHSPAEFGVPVLYSRHPEELYLMKPPGNATSIDRLGYKYTVAEWETREYLDKVLEKLAQVEQQLLVKDKTFTHLESDRESARRLEKVRRELEITLANSKTSPTALAAEPPESALPLANDSNYFAKSGEELAREGRQILEQGHFSGSALTYLKDALERVEGDKAETHFLLSSAYRGQGDYPEAIKHLRIAIKINPDSPDYYFELSKMYRQTGKHKEQNLNLDIAVALAPANNQIRQARAQLRQQNHQFVAAIEDYSLVLLKTPDNIEARLGRAICYEQTPALRHKAREDYHKFLDLTTGKLDERKPEVKNRLYAFMEE